MEFLFIVLSLLAGLVLGSFITSLRFKTAFVPVKKLHDCQEKVGQLEQSNAGRMTKNEVQENFVSRALADTYLEQIRELKDLVKDEQWAVRKSQEEVLRLTTLAEQKIAFTVVEEKNQQITDLRAALAAMQEKEEALKAKLSFFDEELQKMVQLSQEQFKTIATEILEEKKKLFVHENKREISGILDPLKSDLSRFREKIEATRKEDIRDITSLKKEIESLQKLNGQLSDDARSLATALKAEVKMQGNWGEDRLNMILEVEGLQKYIDYSREEVFRDVESDTDRRPDFILKLPTGRHLIIDSKVSLTAYVNYYNADNDQQKKQFLKQHIRSVTDHIDSLANKNYQLLSGLKAPDYVFLFMPVESALTLALNQEPGIFNHALKRKVVLITPTTLVATLKIVKMLWQKENQVKNVEEIFRQCGELYNRFVLFINEMDKIDDALINAQAAHRAAMNHLKDGAKKGSTIVGRFERIRELEAKTAKRIPEKHLAELDMLPDDGASDNRS